MSASRLSWLLGGSCLGVVSFSFPYQSSRDANRRTVLAESPSPSKYSNAIALSREYIETERMLQGVPGITIAVMKDNQLIWTEGFGYADIENRIAATPNSLMRIASISKPLTTTGIGLLLQRKQLNLNHEVQHYIPDYPLVPYKVKESKDDNEELCGIELCGITIEQLCCHQSGIRSYQDDEFHSAVSYSNCIDTLDTFKNDTLEFKSGTDFLYSTYNYCVLSAIMEKVTNRKFIHFMEDEVISKLKMHHTFYETNNNVLNNRSAQYIRKKDKNDLMIRPKSDVMQSKGQPVHSRERLRLYNAPFVDNSNKFAGGGYVSTAEDIAILGNEVVLGDFLSENVKRQLFLDVDNEHNYGMGWMVFRNEEGQITEISHSGGSVGGCSHLLIVPEERLVIALLMNLQNGNPYITRQVARYFVD